MHRSRLRRLSPLVSLVLVLGLAIGACSSDDGSDQGIAPTTTTTEASEDTSSDGTAAEVTVPTDDPYTAAVKAQADAVGIVNVRIEDDTTILVMEDGATEDQIGPACDLAHSLLPDPDPPLSTDLGGTVTPCP